MNRLFVALGQPGAVGEIIGGLLLGPSFIGALFPQFQAQLFPPETGRTLYVLGQVGLILLMFEIGADFDYGHLADRRHRRAALLTALASVSLPFGAGVALGLATHASEAAAIDRTLYALFVGVALAITAVPILGRILREYGLNRAPIGVVAISAAALNDVVGWLLLATISAVAMAQFSPEFLLWRVAALVALGLALRFMAAPLVARLAGDRLIPDATSRLPTGLMAGAIAFALGLAILTEAIGVFAIFGGFLAGLCFHPHPRFVALWKDSLGRFLIVFFLPIFFTLTGLRTDIFGLGLADLPLLLLVLAVAILAKILPCYAAGRLSGFSVPESWLLGGLMNTRALMELVVLNIAYDLGLLPPKIFTMLVLMAVVTTLMTGPLLRRLLPHMGLPLPARGSSTDA
jgi:Kef-type K+ transport system membrane component KefB